MYLYLHSFGKGVTRAWTVLLSSCFHKLHDHCFMSFLQFPRPVKVSMERSPHFELMCPNDVFHIVPPGTSSPLRIRFTPDEMKVRLEEPNHRIISKAIVFPALWQRPIPCCELGSRLWAGSLQPLTPWHVVSGTAPRPDRLCLLSLHIAQHSRGKMNGEQYENDRGVCSRGKGF